MATPNFQLIIDLGSDFIETAIADAMEEEFDIASRKWRVYPSDEEKKHIIEQSLLQLRTKVRGLACHEWAFEQELRLAVAGLSNNIKIPSKDATRSKHRLVRARDGWVIDQDDSEFSIKLVELPDAIRREILEGARTAVFYGVGSYKN